MLQAELGANLTKTRADWKKREKVDIREERRERSACGSTGEASAREKKQFQGKRESACEKRREL